MRFDSLEELQFAKIALAVLRAADAPKMSVNNLLVFANFLSALSESIDGQEKSFEAKPADVVAASGGKRKGRVKRADL